MIEPSIISTHTSSNPLAKKRKRVPKIEQEELVKAIVKLRSEEKLSIRDTATKLNSYKMKTPSGLEWTKNRLTGIFKIIKQYDGK